MKKRIFSILLCLCMVLMLCPMTALAANEDATALQNLLNTSDTVTLAKDYSIDTKLIVNNTVTLDLNGHVIRMTGDDGVIHVNNNISLTLQDSRPNVEHTGEYAGLPAGGVITSDKRAASGGGVYVAENGSFTMSGGTIFGCAAFDNGGGGGVYVGGGSFTMTGGAISGCSSNDGGGGVFVGGGSFTMTGGTISDCSAIKGGDAIAAIDNSTINANGGTIYSEVASFGQILNTSTSGCTEFYGEVKNFSTIDGSGTISGGIFEGEVINRSGADITGGTFRNRVQNNGNISGGIYYGKVENYGTISGGMFYGNISGSIISGKTVTFMKDGSRYALEVVSDDNKVVAPVDPTQDDYIFTGWYTDQGLTNKYQFGQTLPEGITLYAGFEPAPVLAITVNGFQVGNTPKDITLSFASTIPGVEFSKDDIKYVGWEKYVLKVGRYVHVAETEVFEADTSYRCVIELDNKGLREVPAVTMNGKTPGYCGIVEEDRVPVALQMDCELGTPALPPITLTVPFTTTVKLGGSTAPGETTFELAVVHANAIERAYANVEVTAVVTTNGAGSYEGTMTFKGSLEQLQNMLGAGVFVQQVNAGAPNWTYDDTVWSLKLRPIELATDDVAPEYILLICPATLMTSGNGSYYVIDEENPVDEMQFTNTYTYSAPVNDTTTIVIGGEKEESKPVEENPNTGAPVAANMSTLSVLVLASAVAVLKMRKR